MRELTASEKAKGWVRPLRVRVVVPALTLKVREKDGKEKEVPVTAHEFELHPDMAATLARVPGFYNHGLYCDKCRAYHKPREQGALLTWGEDGEAVGS